MVVVEEEKEEELELEGTLISSCRKSLWFLYLQLSMELKSGSSDWSDYLVTSQLDVKLKVWLPQDLRQATWLVPILDMLSPYRVSSPAY